MIQGVAQRGASFIGVGAFRRGTFRQQLARVSLSTTSQVTDDSSSYGLYRLLTSEERNLLLEQRKLTERTRKLASQVGSLDSNVLNESSSFLSDLHLDASFSVVVTGEFNAGKSTLINALLGKKLLECGSLPTTDSITIVANREEIDSTDFPLGVVVHSVQDLSLLEDLTLVDTPGTNSAWMDHTERTLRLLPAADLIFFVTSADRPFSESERTLLKSIQAYRKSIVVIINKMDILDSAGGDHGKESKQATVEFVTDHASEILGARPIVIPVSSRDALSAKLMEKTSFPEEKQRSNVWHRSNFRTLEYFLRDTLTARTKIKSKLASPIGVVEGVMVQCLESLKEERGELQADIATLNILQSQFEGWKKELSVDLAASRQNMMDMVRKEGERCNILLGQMSFYNFHLWALFDIARLEQEWADTKRKVSVYRSKDLEADLLEQVNETADSVATRGRAQGQAVIEYLGNRPARKNQSLVGSVTAASRFEDTRKNLGERLSHIVRDALFESDDVAEKDRLFSSLRQSAILSASLQTGALGSAVAVATQFLEPVPGFMALSSLALGGGACYITGTARIGAKYQEQWSTRAHQLGEALEATYRKEMDRVNRRILDGVAPYTRFVESEQKRIRNLREQCEGVSSAARNLRNRIGKID